MTLINRALMIGLTAMFVSPVFWKVYEHYYRWIFPDTKLGTLGIGVSAVFLAVLAVFVGMCAIPVPIDELERLQKIEAAARSLAGFGWYNGDNDDQKETQRLIADIKAALEGK